MPPVYTAAPGCVLVVRTLLVCTCLSGPGVLRLCTQWCGSLSRRFYMGSSLLSHAVPTESTLYAALNTMDQLERPVSDPRNLGIPACTHGERGTLLRWGHHAANAAAAMS